MQKKKKLLQERHILIYLFKELEHFLFLCVRGYLRVPKGVPFSVEVGYNVYSPHSKTQGKEFNRNFICVKIPTGTAFVYSYCLTEFYKVECRSPVWW